MSLTSMAALTNGDVAMAGNVTGRTTLDLVIAAPDGSRVITLSAPNLFVHEDIALQPASPSGMFLLSELVSPRGSDSEGSSFLQVSRICENGEVVWTRRFDRVPDIGLARVGLVPLPDGGAYVAVNAFHSATATFPKGSVAGHVLRLDAAGNVVWVRLVSAGPDSVKLTATALGPENGLFLFDGHTVIQLARDGSVQWARTIGVPASTDVRLERIAAVAGGLVITGSMIQPDPAGDDGLAISLGGEGNLRWARALDVGPDDSLSNAVEGPAGSVILGGGATRMGPTLEDRVHKPTGWLAALNARGELAWSGQVGGDTDTLVIALSAMGDTAYALAMAADASFSWRSIIVGIPATGLAGQGCSIVRALPTRVSPLQVDLTPADIRSSAAEIALSPATQQFQRGTFVAKRLCNDH